MARIQEDIKTLGFWRSLIAEFMGTMFLVMIGCGAWADQDRLAYLFALKVALAFGFTLAAVLYCMRSLGKDPPHLNPAISLALLITKRTSVIKLALFVGCQMIGAILGAAFVKAITSGGVHSGTGCTVPMVGVGEGQGFGAEFFATFFFVFVVFACYDRAKKGEEFVTPFVIGLTYSAVLLFSIPYTGGSANTARSFGPALVNNIWTAHWIYWFGPLFGGIAGGGVYDLIFSTKASFKRLHACLFVFHRRDESAAGVERSPDTEEGGEAGEIRKDAMLPGSDDVMMEGEREREEELKNAPPGGPSGDRSALRDKQRLRLPRPKFTCCGRQEPPEPPISKTRGGEQQQQPADEYIEKHVQQQQQQQQQQFDPSLDTKETQTSELEEKAPPY